MDEVSLQKYVEELSLYYFKQPFKHQAIFNSRLRTTGGRYHLNTHHLDFNPKILEAFGLDVFEGIVKHELCHYHLHLAGKGYRHGDQEFKSLLKKVEGLRYTPSLEGKKEKISRWEYQCQKCQLKLYRKRRFNTKKYICAQCQGFFTLNERKEIKV